jgi:hypothetical protein
MNESKYWEFYNCYMHVDYGIVSCVKNIDKNNLFRMNGIKDTINIYMTNYNDQI